jgi:hypothetical protein
LGAWELLVDDVPAKGERGEGDDRTDQQNEVGAESGDQREQPEEDDEAEG